MFPANSFATYIVQCTLVKNLTSARNFTLAEIRLKIIIEEFKCARFVVLTIKSSKYMYRFINIGYPFFCLSFIYAALTLEKTEADSWLFWIKYIPAYNHWKKQDCNSIVKLSANSLEFHLQNAKSAKIFNRTIDTATIKTKTYSFYAKTFARARKKFQRPYKVLNDTKFWICLSVFDKHSAGRKN